MAELYPFSEFDFESVVEDKYSSSNNDFWNSSSDPLDQHHRDEDKAPKDVEISEAEDWGESGGLDSLCSIPIMTIQTQEDGLSSLSNQRKEQLSYLDYGSLDNLQFDMVVSSPIVDAHKFDDQIPAMTVPSRPDENYQNQNSSFPFATLDLLNNYGTGLKRLYSETEPEDDRQLQPTDDLRGRKLSTEDVMRIAGTRFIRSSSSDQSEGLDSLSFHPYDCFYSSLSKEEKEDVKLAESLLASAEKVGLGQFERAAKLLHHCESQSSKTGNPGRLVLLRGSSRKDIQTNRKNIRSFIFSGGRNPSPLS